MFTVPAATGVTTPIASTVAMVELKLLQTPPVESFANVIDETIHTVLAPVIVATTGKALMLIDLETEVLQPAAFVNV